MNWRENHLLPGGPARGFTLMEVLLATSVLAVLTGMVLTLTTQILGVWQRTSGDLSLAQETRAALDLLAADAGEMIWREDGREWFQAAAEAGVGEGAMTASAAVHLAFFRNGRDSTGGLEGAGAVSWRLGFRDPFANATGGNYRQFGLYRAEIDAANTFRNGLTDLAQQDLIGRIWQNSAPGAWENLSGDGRGLSPRDWSLDRANLVAPGVVALSLRVEYRDATGRVREALVGSGGVSRVRWRGGLEIDGALVPGARPEALEWVVTSLTPEGREQAARLADNLPENDPPFTWEEILAREGVQATRRVTWPGR